MACARLPNTRRVILKLTIFRKSIYFLFNKDSHPQACIKISSVFALQLYLEEYEFQNSLTTLPNMFSLLPQKKQGHVKNCSMPSLESTDFKAEKELCDPQAWAS